MKLITAVVKPERLDDVLSAVTGAGARGVTVTEVRGFGQQYGQLAAVRPSGRQVRAHPGLAPPELAPPELAQPTLALPTLALAKLRIDVVVRDEVSGRVVEAIAKSVNTGSIGDGKIWVCPVDGALRVRTGEHDDAAV